MQRRSFIQHTGTTAVLTYAGLPALAQSRVQDEKTRLLVVLLRGGMDGLTAVVPVADPLLTKIRKSILIQRPLALNDSFALHPRLQNLHKLWGQGQLKIVHSMGFAYTGRSHFEGQDVMQSGIMKPYTSKSGWLGRGLKLANLQGGVAISIPMPLLLKGDDQAATEFPNWMQPTDQDTLSRVVAMWSADSTLATYSDALQSRPAKQAMAQPNMDAATADEIRSPAALARLAAARLKEELGPRVAVIDVANGFDTHGVQGADAGVLANKLGELDDIMGAFQQAMGDQWRHTLVLTITEFGRTVAENGTSGTDHGVGSCCFLAGGLVEKSGVIADWRGLQKPQLFEERDLPATLDACAIYAQVLERLFKLSPAVIQDQVLAYRPSPLLNNLWI